jgi:hypothetical protein
MKKVYLATMDIVNSIITNSFAEDGTPVGRVVFDYVLRDGYVKANGATVVEASVNYPRLVTFIREHSELLTDDVDANPELYVYNWADDALTLPNLMNRVLQGGDAVVSVNAGLPNITAQYPHFGGTAKDNYGHTDVFGGAMFIDITLPAVSPYMSYTSISNANRAAFDASKSNAIYGASTTVQPPAVKLIPQIRY